MNLKTQVGSKLNGKPRMQWQTTLGWKILSREIIVLEFNPSAVGSESWSQSEKTEQLMEDNYNSSPESQPSLATPSPFQPFSLPFPLVLFGVNTEKIGKSKLILLLLRNRSRPGVELRGLYVNFQNSSQGVLQRYSGDREVICQEEVPGSLFWQIWESTKDGWSGKRT